MATTCRIGILKENKVESIYCHYDGYPAGVGVILKDNYKTKEKVEELIALGDIAELGTTTEFKNFSNMPYKAYADMPLEERRKYTRDYHRWVAQPIKIKTNFDEQDYKYELGRSGVDFLYLFKDGKWFYLKDENEDFEELLI